MSLTSEQLNEAIQITMLYQYNVSAWNIFKEVYGTTHTPEYAEEKVNLIVKSGILGLWAALDSQSRNYLTAAILQRYGN